MGRVLVGMIVTLVVAGCGAAAGPQPTEVTARDAQNGQTVAVHVGDHLKVVLNSTEWTIAASSTDTVLQQQGQQVVSPAPPGSCLPGMGCGTTTAMFVALAKGSATVSATRLSCGEARRCVGQEGMYQLSVRVT